MFNIYPAAKRKAIFERWRKNEKPAKITRYYLDAYLKHKDDTPILREAYAYEAFLLSADIRISKEELIAGGFSCEEPVGFYYGSGTFINDETLKKLASGGRDLSADIAEVRARCYQYSREIFTNEENSSIDAHAATTTWFGGHMVIDYENILSKGLGGYAKDIERCRNVDNTDFYKAMDITLGAIRCFILRFAAAAEELKMFEVAINLEHVAAKAPETFWQALQLVWILHMLDGNDSFGRFDFYMSRFFENDIKKGIITRAQARAFLVDFWLKIESAEQIQNMTLGGTDSDGRPFYPQLTRLCLDITKKLGYKGPNICLRVTENMPKKIWTATIECIGRGLGQPALYNDKVYVESLLANGFSPETAMGYCFAGCSQLMIPGECNFYNDIGLFNIAKIAEITLNNGFDIRTGVQIGPHTGTADSFKSFDDLLDAFFVQLEFFCNLETSIHNKELLYRAAREGYAIRTLFTKDCLEKGIAVFEGGARYNNIQLELIGITNAADHFYAIDTAVFKQKRITLKRLCEVLHSDWENEDELRKYFCDIPKFGNENDGVDDLRCKIADFLYRRFNNTKAVIGGVFVPGEVIFTAHEYCGFVTGATADGRKKGQVLADSAGASGGYDIMGPTAMMNSVLKIPTAGHMLTSVVTNMKFLPETFNSSRTREGIISLLKGFFVQGGMQLQINVCNYEELKKAQKNPDKYRNLVVRVGGYSDYFVRLSPALQEEIIARTAQRF